MYITCVKNEISIEYQVCISNLSHTKLDAFQV